MSVGGNTKAPFPSWSAAESRRKLQRAQLLAERGTHVAL